MKHKHEQNNKQNKTVYAIDFDGTLCNNYFPEIGEPNMALIEYLKQVQKDGSLLILWTCRCGQLLEDAIQWCALYGLKFDYVNENVPWMVEDFDEESRKIFAHYYIDDRAVGYAWSRFRWQIKFQLWLHSRRMARNKQVRQIHDYNKHCAEVDQYLNDHNL